MSQVKAFSDLQVKQPEMKSFVGSKIRMNFLVGNQIIVHHYKIEPSKFEGDRLALQIELNGEKRVAWTSSGILKETIKQVPEDAFPFSTVIIRKEDNRYMFT